MRGYWLLGELVDECLAVLFAQPVGVLAARREEDLV
jgi:hypothetical protein